MVDLSIVFCKRLPDGKSLVIIQDDWMIWMMIWGEYYPAWSTFTKKNDGKIHHSFLMGSHQLLRNWAMASMLQTVSSFTRPGKSGDYSMAIPGTQIGGTYHIQGLCKGYVRGYTPKIWPYMVQYLRFRILEFPLKDYVSNCWTKGLDDAKVYPMVIQDDWMMQGGTTMVPPWHPWNLHLGCVLTCGIPIKYP